MASAVLFVFLVKCFPQGFPFFFAAVKVLSESICFPVKIIFSWMAKQ